MESARDRRRRAVTAGQRHGATSTVVAFLLGGILDLSRPAPTFGEGYRCQRAALVDGQVRCDDEIEAALRATCPHAAPPGALEVRGGDRVETRSWCGVHADGENPFPRMSPESIEALGQPVWLNEASTDELQTLPRIGPALAHRIVDARPFTCVEDVLAVRGIGPATLAAMGSRIRIAPAVGEAASAGR